MGSGWIGELLISTGRVVLPAVLIALIGQFFILRWQHRYRHLERITALQDESYRDAKRILVRMASYPAALAPAMTTAGPPAATSPPSADRSADSAPLDVRAVAQIVSDRLALADLSNDVHRLFSAKAYATVADAAAELYRYHDAIRTACAEGRMTPGEAPSGLQLQRGHCIFKAQRALDALAMEIGRDPAIRPLFRRTVRFGRRREDIPDSAFSVISGLAAPPAEQAGKRRRYAETMVEKLAGSRRGTADRNEPAPGTHRGDA